jgi:hypothetical protein
MVAEVVVEVKVLRMVDLVAETAQGVTAAAAAAEAVEEEEVVAAVVEEAGVREARVMEMEMETMETEVEMQEMVVQAVLMVATGTGMAQDLARKIHSCWEVQPTVLTWEDWSFN